MSAWQRAVTNGAFRDAAIRAEPSADALLARYGGEEFLLVVPGTDARVAETMTERTRSVIDAAGVGATISIGVASWTPRSGNVSDLVNAADVALYTDKRERRNQVAVSKMPGPA
ncbi:MAG: GGDEF domain-containing protein [Tahibacter sp.]